MGTKKIEEMIEESRKHKFSEEIERLQKILEELEQHEKSKIINKIEYWKAE
jgi:hypothetical protein